MILSAQLNNMKTMGSTNAKAKAVDSTYMDNSCTQIASSISNISRAISEL
jgi:hypothetical protein